MTVDKAEIQAMINASVAPIGREVKRQRKRVAAIEKRVETVEGDIKSALQIGELVQQVVQEGMARIELKMDKQHAEKLARLDRVEGWIHRRTVIERTVVRVSQLTVMAALRRWLPFFGMLSIVLVMWWVLVSLMGSGL